MSSYLNIYLVPKKDTSRKKVKPLLLTSYCRNSNIYGMFVEVINVTYAYKDDEMQYTELTSDLMSSVIASTGEYVKEAQEHFDVLVESYSKLPNLSNEVVENYSIEYNSRKSYLNEMQETLNDLKCLQTMLFDTDYSDFEKVLINID